MIITGELLHGLLEIAVRRAKTRLKTQNILSEGIMRYWDNPEIPRPAEGKIWVPKNPDINFSLRREIPLTDDQWQKSCFPHQDLPPTIQNHVDLKNWREMIKDLPFQTQEMCKPIMTKVLENLEKGCDAKIGPPGCLKTISSNNFEDPAIDIPRIADALASEIRAGHMAGPFPLGHIKDAKVNGLMSVVKPDGARRQVGNLSAPAGRSFNDGIDKNILREWKVTQTTSRDIADMIIRAGRNAILTCSDMISAYKNLPVTLNQRRLQVFRFCGKEFVDLKLIFGDKSACMFYDRFHFCIVAFLVLPLVRMPQSWTGRTVDDLTTVVPSSCELMAKEFVDKYRSVLQDLKIGAAPADPERRKAFDGHTSGEMLGIVFDTEAGTWHLPKSKALSLLTLLAKSISVEALSVNEVEVLHGKLAHFTQHAPALSCPIPELLAFLKLFHEEGISSARKVKAAQIYLRLDKDVQEIMFEIIA